mgnify:FL=1
MDIENILNKIQQVEHGFQHIIDATDEILASYSKEESFELALKLFKHDAYQVRMLATTMLGRLATEDNDALRFLKEQVGIDKNWRVQEMLAKAFDDVCRHRGYETCLPLIEEWVNDDNPNVIRAVTEGLRIWTSRPFFKENPLVAIALIAKNKAHESEYVRKSVGNALKDISKKHNDLIQSEVSQWDLNDTLTMFTYKYATKLLKK